QRDLGDVGPREARLPPAGFDARPHVEGVEPFAQLVETFDVARGLGGDLVGLALRLLGDLLGHRVDDELAQRLADLGLGGRRVYAGAAAPRILGCHSYSVLLRST